MLNWPSARHITRHSRYKPRSGREKTLITHKKLRYFLITPRLQKLFMSSKTVEYMTWHQSHDVMDGMIVHPSNNEAWKHFNSVHPYFSAESRNIRLGLCIDRFNPFGSFAAPSTHLDFNPNLWMEARLSGGLDRNRVYGLSNTVTKNLRTARSVSTIRSSQSISSTQFQEFTALQQHTTNLIEKYERLSKDYEQLFQMVMDMRIQMGGTCAPSFWPYGPRNDQSPPPSAPP